MAKMPWLKLYTEIRTDPKMQALSDLEFRAWINILCLAAESKVRGVICIEDGLAYPIEGLARALFITVEELKDCLSKFQRLRMIDLDEAEIITVIHFDDRQYDKPSDRPEEVAKRARKYRARKNNVNVTPLQRDKNAIEEDKEKEGDIDKELDINNNSNNAREEKINVNGSAESTAYPEENPNGTHKNANDLDETILEAEENRPMDLGTRAVNWAEKNWGRPISPGEARDIIAWCDDFSSKGSPDADNLVIEALNQCDAAGPDKRNRNYLQGILKQWRAVGIITVDQAKAREAEHKRVCQKEHKRENKGSRDRPQTMPKADKYEKFYL